ncbi:MAG: AAA family ATPase [Actinomycetota bacterium]
MAALRIAVVSNDPDVRLEAARAFDGAPASWFVSLHTTAPEDVDIVVLGPDAEGEGIPFDPADSQSVIEEIESRTGAREGAVIVVTSASGGVGATSLALHLAAALAPALRVGFIELAPRAALRLGLAPGEHLTWADLDESSESIARCFLPIAPGFRALLAPEDGGEAGLALKRSRSAFDLLVVDAPARIASESLCEADAGVLVMGPSVPQAHWARAFIEEWPDLDWAVVINRLGRGGETTRAQLADLAGRPISLELPCSPALRDAEDDGRLVSLKWTRYGRAITRLADALVIR